MSESPYYIELRARKLLAGILYLDENTTEQEIERLLDLVDIIREDIEDWNTDNEIVS